MRKKNVWIAGLVTQVMIAMLLLLAGSPSVTANDQPKVVNAEVKIDNFSFAPATLWCRSNRHLPFFHPQEKDQQPPQVIAHINFSPEVPLHQLLDALLLEERTIFADAVAHRFDQKIAQRAPEPFVRRYVEPGLFPVQDGLR